MSGGNGLWKSVQQKYTQNKSLFVKQDMPPLMLFCHSHCDFYPIELKIDREHLLSMTNVCMKFEKVWPNQTLSIDRTSLYTTDG